MSGTPIPAQPEDVVQLGNIKIPTSFSLATISRVEDVTGKSCFDLSQRLVWIMGVNDDDVEVEEDDAEGKEKLQTLRSQRMVSRFRVSEVATFIAGCAGVTPAEILGTAHQKKLIDAFMRLANAFVQATSELLDAEVADPAVGHPTSAGSGQELPGPALSSASDATSS